MSIAIHRIGVALACVLLAGCPRSAPSGEDAGGLASVPAEAGPAAAGDAGVEAGAGAAKAGAPSSFSGKYTLTAGTMYVPAEKDWAGVKFKNDETRMLGEGDITLAVDGAGRVSGGTESGPLGASVLDGSSDGTTLVATLRRKTPSDEGLTGTVVATIAGDKLEGTMKLAESNAAVVRVATLRATRK